VPPNLYIIGAANNAAYYFCAIFDHACGRGIRAQMVLGDSKYIIKIAFCASKRRKVKKIIVLLFQA
jgi:hypothetical protein